MNLETPRLGQPKSENAFGVWTCYTFCDRAPPQGVCVLHVCLARDARKDEKKEKAYRETSRLGPHSSVETDDAGLVHLTGRDELVIHIRLPRHLPVLFPQRFPPDTSSRSVFKSSLYLN